MAGDRSGLTAIVISGPTASGKSAVALELAERFGGDVINADSMQVYRELKLLTARPEPADMAGIPHHLYGTVEVAESYSVGHWLADAAAALKAAQETRRLPILVGGTGLYFKALLEGLSPLPDIPPETRELWRERSERLDAEGLFAELKARDPVMAERLMPSDKQRVVRALEVIAATGITLAEWQATPGTPTLQTDDVLKLVVAPERELLYRAIDARFDRMIDEGAIDEVRALVDLRLRPGLPAMRALGVRELAACLAGTATLEEAATKAKTESRRYAKRQMSWTRRFMADWEWFADGSSAVEAASAHNTT
ncbi:MAG: tRNA (adenosine(37)-N6)-dimethylallyltransferase MiaA [Methyloceanibacter sp.]